MDIKIFEQVFEFCGINKIKILFCAGCWYFCFLIKDAHKEEVEALSFCLSVVSSIPIQNNIGGTCGFLQIDEIYFCILLNCWLSKILAS